MRHHHVEDEQVERKAAHGRPRRRRVDGGGNTEAMLLQIAGEQVADAAVVVDNQNMRTIVVRRLAAMQFDRSCHRHDASAFPSLSGTGDEDMMEETLGRSSALIIACRKRRTTLSAPGAGGLQRFGKADELRRCRDA